MGELELSGKRVIVTGAAGGLGRAFAEAFASAGAKVIAADIDAAGAQETARLIRRRAAMRWLRPSMSPTLRPPRRLPARPMTVSAEPTCS